MARSKNLTWAKLGPYTYGAWLGPDDYEERDSHVYTLVRVPSGGYVRYDVRVSKIASHGDLVKSALIAREVSYNNARLIANCHAMWLKTKKFKGSIKAWRNFSYKIAILWRSETDQIIDTKSWLKYLSDVCRRGAM